jgi:transposase
VQVLSDAQWDELWPLIEDCRPRGKTPPRDLRRTIEAILWRHQNGAKWRAIPDELGPWWRAAQTFLDGTNIRAHAKAAGAAKRGATARSEIAVKRLAGLVVGLGRRPA